MSRKSDISQAEQVFWSDKFATAQTAIIPALEAAYDLGRAAQADRDTNICVIHKIGELGRLAKRLRAKVRKMVEGK